MKCKALFFWGEKIKRSFEMSANILKSGPSCSKPTMSLVKVSLKL